MEENAAGVCSVSVRGATSFGVALAQHLAGEALRDAQLGRDMLDAGPTARGAQTSPEAASLRTGFSSVRSAAAWRGRAFSASSCFSRFTWSSFAGTRDGPGHDRPPMSASTHPGPVADRLLSAGRRHRRGACTAYL